MERPPLLRIAHRGASGHRPENTLAAFRYAIELGTDMIEVDCQLTGDGAPVILHDETLDRTTDGRGPLRLRTLAEVRALDAGSWFSPQFAGERVPTLEETVETVRDGGVGLNLELKGDDDPGRLELISLGILASYRFLPRTVFSSFSPRRMRALRERSAEARIAILLEAGASWAGGLALARELAAEALHPDRALATARHVAEAHEHGLAVRVWPVNRPKEVAALLERGVDGIFTDFPERLPAPDATSLP